MGSVAGTTARNRPHQVAVHYSAKGYDEYRADLLQRLAQNGIVVKEGEQDFLNAFIDLTAYLGEVLMTYQNAYAQEIYLETAQLRESLFGLALMVDYRVRPGAAATGTLVVTAKPGKSGLLTKGFQVSGKEETAKEDVIFETDSALHMDAAFNDFSLAQTERFNDETINTGDSNWAVTVRGKVGVIPGQYIHCSAGSPEGHYFARVQSSTANEEQGTTRIICAGQYSEAAGNIKAGEGVWELMHSGSKGVFALRCNSGDRTGDIWLDGKYEDIAVKSPIVLHHGTKTAYGIVSQVSFATIYIKTAETTRISDNPDCGANEEKKSEFEISTKKFYVIRKTYVEPREVAKLTVAWSGGDLPADYGKDPGDSGNAAEKSSAHVVLAGVQKPLKPEGKIRSTACLKGKSDLKVDGDFRAMQNSRRLLLHEEIGGEKYIEEAAVAAVVYSAAAKCSTITLKKPIDGDFTLYGIRVWGNVVVMTQGKTGSEATLGSGRGEESYQTFDLPRSPLTFVMKGREGLQGAINVKIGDLLWTQQNDFLDSRPEDRHYIVETDYAGKSRVVFGDGVNGSRLPTGRDNVVARFRTGQGTGGNVAAGILKKAASRPPFLDSVSNPEKTAGGSDPDTEEQLRQKIPAQHLTFDRAVSLRDYADLALSCPGIAKAKAGWRWLHDTPYVFLAVAGSGGADLSSDALKVLREYLDARRDPNQPLIIRKVDVVPVELSTAVRASAGRDTERVKEAITQALGVEMLDDGSYPFFCFERLNIGMSIHKKDIYRIIENIPGVETVTHLEIRRSAGPAGYLEPSYCPGDVWLHNWELPGLDVRKRDIKVTAAQIGTICEKAGG